VTDWVLPINKRFFKTAVYTHCLKTTKITKRQY